MGSSSVSEGEVIESDSEKATTAQTLINDKSIDRQSRSPGAAPYRATYERRYDRSRSRSPFRHNQRKRSPRGEKRRRVDDGYDEFDRSDRRHFHADQYRRRPVGDDLRGKHAYSDLDRSHPSYPSLSYGDRDEDERHWSPRAKTRSRSPERSSHRNGYRSRDDRMSRREGKGWRDRDGRRRDDDKKHEPRDHTRSSWDEYPPSARNDGSTTETRYDSFAQDKSTSAAHANGKRYVIHFGKVVWMCPYNNGMVGIIYLKLRNLQKRTWKLLNQ